MFPLLNAKINRNTYFNNQHIKRSRLFVKLKINEENDIKVIMIRHIWTTEMTDPIFHWEKIEQFAKRKEPLLVYSKAKIPVDFLIENPQIGFNLTISGWGNTWLEPNVPDVIDMINYFNQLTKVIDINRLRLRIDPGVPTKEGINKAITVIKNIEVLPKVITSIIQYYTQQYDIFKQLGIDLEFYRIQSGRAVFPKKEIAVRWLQCLREARPEADISFCGMPYTIEGSNHTGCIDDDMLTTIGVKNYLRINPGKQRPGCKCVISKRQACIGDCNHGCRYCYAHKENAITNN